MISEVRDADSPCHLQYKTLQTSESTYQMPNVCRVIRMCHLLLWRILYLQSKKKACEESLKSEVISNQEVHSIIKTEFTGDVRTNRSEPTWEYYVTIYNLCL